MNSKIKGIYGSIARQYQNDLKSLVKDHNHHEQLYGERKVNGSKIEGDLLPVRTRPRLLPLATKHYIEATIKTVYGAVKKVEQAILQNQLDIKRYLNMPENIWRIFKINPGYTNTIPSARFDTSFNGTDLRFWEINTNSPRGHGIIDELYERYKTLHPLATTLAQKDISMSVGFNAAVLQMLLQVYKNSGGKKTKPNIAIILWENYVLRFDAINFQSLAHQKGYHCEIIDPRQFTYQGGCLTHNKQTYDVAIKNIDLNEMMPRLDAMQPFVKAYRDNAFCLVSPFAGGVVALKSLFDIFTNKRFASLFNPVELKTLQAVIPWTRVLRHAKTDYGQKTIDLVPFVKKNKDRFIIKAVDGTGAAEIFIGVDTSSKEWQRAVAQFADKNWIVQEKTGYYFEQFPAIKDNKYYEEKINVDLLPFVIGNKILYYSRSSPSSITNFIKGGAITFVGFVK